MARLAAVLESLVRPRLLAPLSVRLAPLCLSLARLPLPPAGSLVLRPASLVPPLKPSFLPLQLLILAPSLGETLVLLVPWLPPFALGLLLGPTAATPLATLQCGLATPFGELIDRASTALFDAVVALAACVGSVVMVCHGGVASLATPVHAVPVRSATP